MKKILGLSFCLLGLLDFNASIVDASWLSKAWNRLETSSNNLAKEKKFPTHKDSLQWQHYGQMNGVALPTEDMSIAGISVGSNESVLNSLGPAQSIEKKARWIVYHYGSIAYHVEQGKIVLITVEKRDAITRRGIAVGDSLVKVYDSYGTPNLVKSDNTWVYGRYFYPGDQMYTLVFVNNGKKVTRIEVMDF